MKMTLIAAGALAVASIAPITAAEAKDIGFSMTLGGPNGYVHIGAPGPKHQKGPGYGYKHYGPGKPGYGHYYGPRGYGCLSPREIRRSLRHRGWFGFHGVEIRPHAFKGRARRPNGVIYKLKVDRCTGQIIRAKPLFAGYGPGYGYNGYGYNGYGHKGHGGHRGWK